MKFNDTIVAQATPPGIGGISVIRISGIKSSDIAKAVLGKLPKPRYADYLFFKEEDGTKLDQGIAIWFPGPNSFTGEDTLELHGHGGPIVIDMLLKRILKISGVRIANPGEFCERAFLNEKIDLTQAEAIADLIEASSNSAAKAAINSLQGAFSARINDLKKAIIRLRVYMETIINFSDEEIDFISDKNIKFQFHEVISCLDKIKDESKTGKLLREGMRIVIAGYPNAGKSSILNSLVGKESAIVTDIAGTTRDVVHEHIYIHGIPFHITDTAGLRETVDKIELIGIERAWKEIKIADHILFVVDSTKHKPCNLEKIFGSFILYFPEKIPITIVRNKIDITGEASGINNMHGNSIVCLSAKTGKGLDSLREHLKNSIGFNKNIESSFLARRRHLEAIKLVGKHLENSKIQLLNNGDIGLIAEELRLAQKKLSEITGEFTSNDLLNSIFSSFCIGK